MHLNHPFSKRALATITSLALCASLVPSTAFARPDAAKPKAAVRHQHAQPDRKVKNVIVLISDGMGYAQLEAANLYGYGRRVAQSYERFPVRVGMSTFAHPSVGGAYDPSAAWASFDYVKNNPTDSAAAASAMSTGIKTYNAGLGVDIDGLRAAHALEAAEELGKATGVVSSVQISHATPAGFVAHNASRNNYEQIANEMLHTSAVDVIMGAGNPFWTDSDTTRTPSASSYRFVGGQATWDGLVAGTVGGDADGDGDSDAFKLVQTPAEFAALTTGATPARVVGIAQCASTLQQSRGGDTNADPFVAQFNRNVPTLETMTKAALNVLDENPNGLFLMIEGGAVDWAGHANQKGRIIEEQVDFNNSVDAVIEWVDENSNWGETLVIVTGDHETGYLTGPGSGSTIAGPVWNPLANFGIGVAPGMQFNSGDHTNSLIPLFAKGSAARHLRAAATGVDPVRGEYLDNTDIAKTVFATMK
ncbi:MAG: alkaline phosphatase [Coriobacteriia bacterium]|nr:alkaline phosphatase [Coriobacteriia bacterium]